MWKKHCSFREECRSPTSNWQNSLVCKGSFSAQPTELREVALRWIFPKTTIWRILWKCLLLKAYKLQAVSTSFKTVLQLRAVVVLLWASREPEGANVVQQVVCSNEITFHLGGKAKRQNILCWSFHNPDSVIDHERFSPQSECVLIPFMITKIKVRSFLNNKH